MSGEKEHGFAEGLRRFFRLPRDTPRSPAPTGPLLPFWPAFLIVGAGGPALGWEAGPLMMLVAAQIGVLDGVIEGVRHRWPAAVLGLAAGWATIRLTPDGLTGSEDSLRSEFATYTVGSLVALAVFATVTRLPGHRYPAESSDQAVRTLTFMAGSPPRGSESVRR
ncbi:hypothetical protein [Streptomyces sp. NPDC002845]